MSSDEEKKTLKWFVKFNYKEEYSNSLIDLKDTLLFDNKYPVFKMKLAEDLLNNKQGHFFRVRRADHPVEIRDPMGKSPPSDSCLLILGISQELGMVKMLFFPQPGERLVLVAIDEVWIKVVENVEESQRLTVLTNVAASMVTNPEAWSQVYLVY